MGSSKRHHSKLSLIVTIGFIFQVLLSPIAMASDCTYEDGSYMATEKANCEATEGKAWDCASNKCVYDDTTTTMKDSYAQCDGIEDDAKRKECVDSVAMGAGKDAGMTNENYAKEAAKAAELLGWANLIWGALMGGSQSTCTSTTIMKWTGLAQTAGELYAYFFLSDKVSDLHEEYNKKTVAAENYDAQRDAFLFLKEEQETIAKVAKQKNMIYTVAAAGYTAAAGFALYESAMMFAGKLECTFATDSGALACGQVVAKQGEKGKDLKEAFNEDKNFFTEMSGKDKDKILDEVKERAGKAASSSFDEMKSWQELANQAKEATRSQNFSQAKSNFSKLPESTQQTTIFNIKSAINNAQKLEVITVNTSPSDANYKTYVKDLIKQWSEISKQATEIGDEESAARANKKIDLWTSKLNSQSSVDREIMNVFALTEPQFNEMNAKVAYSTVEGATTDLNAYIAFKEWHSFNRGNKSSFDLVTYRVVKDYAPDFISFGHIGFKGSLLYMIRFNLMTEAYAGSAGEKIGNLAKGMAIGALKTYALKFAMCTIAPNVSNLVSTWLQAPPAVAVMASASAMVNFKLAGVAKKEQQQAEKNAKILEAVLAKFELAQATYCPAGRDDLNNPQCYCYTDNGDKNSNRSNSETCQNLWSKNDTDYFTKAGTYNSSSSGGCAYLNGKYDLDCKCKKLIDSRSGSNACMKSPVTSSTLRGISVPSFGTTASTIGDYLESTGSGAASTGDLDTAAIGNAAQNQKKINDKMAENLNKKLASKGMSPIKLNTEAAMDKLVNSVVPQGNLRSSLLNRAKLQNSSTGNKAMNEKGKKALEEALKQSGIQYEGASSGAGAKKDNYSYLFENSSAARGPKTKVDNSYMKKKYNYNNEINNDKDASIFDIISKRYTLSGMKKLFGD